jgi:hypothetical protein
MGPFRSPADDTKREVCSPSAMDETTILTTLSLTLTRR